MQDENSWRDLLPWATPEERRELLDSEALAARFAERLAVLGVCMGEAFEHPKALEVLAVLLAEHHGHPMRLLEGEPLGEQ